MEGKRKRREQVLEEMCVRAWAAQLHNCTIKFEEEFLTQILDFLAWDLGFRNYETAHDSLGAL